MRALREVYARAFLGVTTGKTVAASLTITAPVPQDDFKIQSRKEHAERSNSLYVVKPCQTFA